MKRRCSNQNRRNYKDYGGRGIKVCDDWINNYLSFYNWSIENGYTDELSIERINNDGNYEPNNCTWITLAQQKSNTRSQKAFKAISPDGMTYYHKVIRHFAIEHDLHAGIVSDCLRGRQKTHRGWKFEYVE